MIIKPFSLTIIFIIIKRGVGCQIKMKKLI